jgi:beta-N-acetylhexosaminidase
MLDVQGHELTPEDRELLAHPVVGGVILFARNVDSVAQVRALTDAMRAAAKRPLLIAVDQEGGRVQRLKNGFSRLPPLRQITSPQQAREMGWLMANEVRAVGIDISFAPVLDLDFGVSSVIGDRSLGRDVDTVVGLARAYIAGMREAGMLATGKHFPGHGFVVADSHVDIPVDERTLVEIERDCLSVFRLLAAELGAMMAAHVIYPQIDPVPAGFSTRWLKTILRQQLQFNGCVFSDDLSMHGASVAGDAVARARAALEAGCDMLLVCNDRASAIQVIDALPHQIASEQRLRIAQMVANDYPTMVNTIQSSRWQAAQRWLA